MKKAETSGIMGTVVALILVILIAFTFSRFIMKSGQEAKRAIDYKSCEASIQKSVWAKTIPLGMVKPRGDPGGSLNCPREELTISKNDVVNNGKIDQTKAHSIIAEEMRRCWGKVGAGKLDPFSDWNDIKDKSICLICSRIKFDKDLENFMQTEYAKFSNGKTKYTEEDLYSLKNFFITNPLPYLIENKIPGKEYSYYKYFFGSEANNKLSQEDLAKLGTSLVDENTLILVRMYKPDERKLTWTKVGGWTLAIAGVVVGVATVVAGVLLFFPSFGSSTVLVVGGVSLSVASVATIVTVTGTVIMAGGATIMAVSMYQNGFADCPTCNGVGSIQMVPSTYNLYEKIIPYEDKDGNTENKALCDILVN